MEVKKPKYYEYFKKAIQDGLKYINQYISKNKFISTYYGFPKLEYFKTRFPHFTSCLGKEEPKDYSSVFNPRTNKSFDPSSIASWKEFRDLLLGDKDYCKYFNLVEKSENLYLQFMLEYHTYTEIEKMIDRYIHSSSSFLFEEEKFAPLYKMWKNSIFVDPLPIRILVPLVISSFEADSYELTENHSIIRMSDEVQLARWKSADYVSASPHPVVLGAATHAFQLKNWTVSNKTYDGRRRSLFEINSFHEAIESIELFFASFRAVTANETGYSQIVSLPINWSDSTIANLPTVYSVATREYPVHFENYGWLSDVSKTTNKQIEDIAVIFKSLLRTESNKLKLAAKRLNRASLRKSEEDTILDITIGLETLMVGDSRSEMTYKLAMRISALLDVEPIAGYTKDQIFDVCKKIYDYRSAVIHGSTKVDSKRKIKFKESKEIQTIEAAIEIYRWVFKILCKNQNLLDPNQIDGLLLKQTK